MSKTLEINWTKRQAKAFRLLQQGSIKDLLYGGAKGGGKSHFGCVWCYVFCLQIISQFSLQPTDKPLHLGWMGRKQASDFAATTLQTWQRVIPPECYELKGGTEKTSKHILILGTVALDYGGLDRQENINKFNSAEYAFFFVDQAEEVERDDISVLRASRRLTIDGHKLPYKGLFTANPAQCWLKDDFIDNSQDNYAYVPALPTDNPYLPDDYIETLKDSFQHRPELLEGYLNGSWDCFEGADQVIKNSWIASAKTLTLNPVVQRRFISCDPARFGDDETVIYVFENTTVKEEHIFGQKDLHYTSGYLNKLSLDNGDIPIIVDGDGLGAGIIDNLQAYDRQVIEYRGSAKAKDDAKYHNTRAEAWDKTGIMMSEGDIEFNHEDTRLVSQLCTPKYEFRNGKILIEPKEKIKNRTGTSPDRADAYVMGMYNYNQIEPVSGAPRRSGGVTLPDFVMAG